MLPGLDGTGVARRIRATSNVPIINRGRSSAQRYYHTSGRQERGPAGYLYHNPYRRVCAHHQRAGFLRSAWRGEESKKGRMADALAHGGDEGRDKLR